MTSPSHQGTCHVCGKTYPATRLHPWFTVRAGVGALVEQAAPGWAEGRMICRDDLARFRRAYVENMLADERGDLTALDHEVLDSLQSGQLVTRQTDEDPPETFGERAADAVASFGGSWTFILMFAFILTAWIAVNLIGILRQPFDPYPFILLNLVLSCVAACQAPVIMMSQRRQETKDRQRSQNDYMVNLKAELEIRQLHEKIDHQLVHQWQKLVEMQQIQIDLLEERLRGR